MAQKKVTVQSEINNEKTTLYKKTEGAKLCLDKEKIQNRPFYHFWKRMVDIILSIIGLVLTIPILLVVGLLMKKDEPGQPIFFSQIRVGKNGKQFKMYKVRSMVVDAEERLKEIEDQNEIDGAMFKIKNDPRITRIGKFIRKTSIDELPQFINVLMGDMSIVGPRPPLPREVEKYTPYDMQRLYVKPGCTGLWQVSGRNDVHFDDMVGLDIEYIENQSLGYDWEIIFKTVKVIVMPNSAY